MIFAAANGPTMQVDGSWHWKAFLATFMSRSVAAFYTHIDTQPWPANH